MCLETIKNPSMPYLILIKDKKDNQMYFKTLEKNL